jgi:general secretion pathway protein D
MAIALLKKFGLILVVVTLSLACAARTAFRQGEAAARAGDIDQAVAHYRTALQSDPGNPDYRIALERAMLAASRVHLERARDLEKQDQLEAARSAYRQASEYDPTNRAAAQKVTTLDQLIRDRMEAGRPKTPLEELRDRVRAATAPPVLNPASREPLNLRFPNTGLRDVLDFIASFAGINVTYDGDFRDRDISLQLAEVTLEEALDHLMTMNQLAYKVLSERSIFIYQDTPAKRMQYEEQVIQTFFVSHTDPVELVQILSSLVRLPGLAVQPIIQANKTSNTIVVRGTRPLVEIIERLIAQNDKPRAEIVIDVQILEVNRTRAKQYGLNLSEYALGGLFSPEFAPDDVSTPPPNVVSPPPVNVDTISRGLSASDFYTAVPTAIVRFLESDTSTKLIAKTQLRGAEGTKLILNLGDDIPVITTSYTPLATGGAGVNPLSSYSYRSVGVNIDLTPRVTLENDVVLDLILDNSSLGPNVSVAGINVPSFGKRALTTRLRLRDGESNLLAGLLREDERTALTGFPGIIHLPVLRQLFSANKSDIMQTDIVMLLTPHIIRTSEIKESDLVPISIGSQQNLGLSNPASPFSPNAEGAPPPAPAPALPAPPGGAQNAPPIPAPADARSTFPTPTPAPGATGPAIGAAQVTAILPQTPLRVGGGPYTVPISIDNAMRISTITLTLTFDPSVLRVRAIQEGSFVRTGGAGATLTPQINPGRLDVTITRSADVTGASGSGVLGAVLFDTVAAGSAQLGFSGAATSPDGTPIRLQFTPVVIAVQP